MFYMYYSFLIMFSFYIFLVSSVWPVGFGLSGFVLLGQTPLCQKIPLHHVSENQRHSCQVMHSLF